MAPLLRLLDAVGAPTEPLLHQARIPLELLDNPEALVPLHLAHGFAELASRSEGIDNLGLVLGQQTSAFALGAFGEMLQHALTVYEYLNTGIRLIGSVTSGQRYWLSAEGDNVRFNQFVPGPASPGRCHGDLYGLAITITMLRSFAAAGWDPEEICLLAGDEMLVGDRLIFGDARVATGQTHSSFTLPRSLLETAISKQLLTETSSGGAAQRHQHPMPEDFLGSVEQLILALLPEGYPDVTLAAEAAGMGARTLQRRLAETGHSYSQMVNQMRVRLAAERLAHSTSPIWEIAAELGYANASNFTRAFRRQTGTSPQHYRRQHR